MSSDFIDSIACLYSATVSRDGDSYVVEVPRREVELGSVRAGSTVRVAILSDGEGSAPRSGSRSRHVARQPEPPVEVGDVREVTVESTGDQGDGIAKIDRGFVVIVPGAVPGDEVTVEIDTVQPNYAVGRIVEEAEEEPLW